MEIPLKHHGFELETTLTTEVTKQNPLVHIDGALEDKIICQQACHAQF